jgi:poly-gamma-glutamate synthesis protein (capsule biosynthesis protein)
MVVAGDAMAHSPQLVLAHDRHTGGYDFSGCFRYLEDILADADFSVVNLETTLGGAPYSSYPQFCTPDAFAFALREAGFDFFLLANNHCADTGAKGAERTIRTLREGGIPSAGVYLDADDRAARYPAVTEVNGISIALLNYTYGTNGLRAAPPVSVNYLGDTLQIKADIEAARARKADIIVAFLHWGTEYVRLPDPAQKEWAAFFFRCGVDVIIGSHPHVVQPVEYFAYDETDTTKRKLVYWSLGNLISNQRRRHTDGGILASLSLVKNKHTQTTRVESYESIPYWVYKNRDIYPGYFVLPVARFQRDPSPFTFSAKDRSAFERFVGDIK